jgi:hypothetical protein
MISLLTLYPSFPRLTVGTTQTFIALSVQLSPSLRLVWFTLCVDMNLADRCLLNPVGRSRHPAVARGGTKRVVNEIICCSEDGGTISTYRIFACFYQVCQLKW